MHAVFLGIDRLVAKLLMKLPELNATTAIDVLNARIELINEDVLSGHRVPTIPLSKASGQFHLPTGKAADSKYLFCFFITAVLEGMLPPGGEGQPGFSDVVRLTARISQELATGDFSTAESVQQFRDLVIAHHKAFARVFGEGEVTPNLHWSAFFFMLHSFSQITKCSTWQTRSRTTARPLASAPGPSSVCTSLLRRQSTRTIPAFTFRS
jgi:hypothetical protein